MNLFCNTRSELESVGKDNENTCIYVQAIKKREKISESV